MNAYTIESLLENNRNWVAERTADDPGFFQRLATRQSPKFLWIGCSDSRVPANQIVGLDPGELFVHRNVANIVSHADINCLSVLEFAVRILDVEHIIVCGHYGCGGVRTSLEPRNHGLIDNWLRSIRDVHRDHQHEIDSIHDDDARVDRLCELNVAAQVHHVAETAVVQEAWMQGKRVAVHGWIYDINEGLLRDLGVTTKSAGQIHPAFRLDPAGPAES